MGDLTQNAAFMDLYSRQIGAYGIETMGKLVKMSVLIVGLKGIGVEAAKNLVLAGPGAVILHDDEPVEVKDLGANFFLTESDIGKPRAQCCIAKLQELNSLVRVSVHQGKLTEELVGGMDVVVMTTANRDELIRWNEFCRNHKAVSHDSRGKEVVRSTPIRFISVAAFGVMGYIFSDFGPDFSVMDQTGEPPVQRVVTNITNSKEGIVSLLNPMESELAKKADIADTEHEGFITFSEVEGMYAREENEIKSLGHSINSSGPWRAREVWRKELDYLVVPKERGGDGVMKAPQYFVHVKDSKGNLKKDADRPDGLYWDVVFPHEASNIPEELFVRDQNGNKLQRMTEIKDHYKIKIGDTSGYSKYQGGGIVQQVYQPVVHHHKSFAQSLQQPIGLNSDGNLLMCDGDKENLGWWYPMLHIVKQGLFQFASVEGRLPAPNNDAEAERVLQFCRQYNDSARALQNFCGKHSALATIDLNLTPKAPPTVEGLDEDRLSKIEELKGMGATVARAILALEEANWDTDSAMMILFDEEAMQKLEAPIKVFNCLTAMKRLVLAAGAELQPIAVFLGGVCAQEVVKHCGKFTPLNQWLHFDCYEILPDQILPVEETRPINSRYDNNIALFGATTQHKLNDIKTFLVGCGALGCELLKNFAMLGVACGENGLITVTDGDRIEVSNLNRQFLFRKQHVKKPKSTTAAEAVQAMNKDIKVDALELLAMKETENVFNDDFWLNSGIANKSGNPIPCSNKPSDGRGLNFVVNALDNVKTRKYMDARCVFYKKPLLESGTEGTKFNHQVVIPGETVSYDEGEPEAQVGEAIPMCTLRNFPSTIIHCIEWARGLFEDIFVSPVADLESYLKNPAEFISNIRDQAESFCLDANEIQTFKDKLCDKEGNGLIKSMRWAKHVKDHGYNGCVDIANEIFYQKFNFSMKDLQHQFPKDHMVNGKLFWSPPKRYPTELFADLSDESVASFYVAVTNLVAVAFGLCPLPVNGIDDHGNDYDTFIPLDSPWRDVKKLESTVPKHPLVWKPSSTKIDTDEKANDEPQTRQSSLEEETKSLLALLDELEGIAPEGITAQPADFEKDQDLNFHIDFVNAASNLRATNYGIGRSTRHKTKMIAGKIIAAIATSTACATALVCIELIKLVQKKSRAQHRDSSNNFAVNQFQMSEPGAANVIRGNGEKKITPDPLNHPQYFDVNGNILWDLIPAKKWRAYPDPHTKWDTITVSSELTLQEAIDYFKSQHNLKLMNWLVTLKDENGKTIGKQIFDEPPVDTSIDEELLLQIAPLSLTQQKAIIAITKCTDMKNKQSYSQRWNVLKQREGDDFKKKMFSTLKDLFASYGGCLDGISRYELEVSFEIANEPGVEAITPPVIMEI